VETRPFSPPFLGPGNEANVTATKISLSCNVLLHYFSQEDLIAQARAYWHSSVSARLAKDSTPPWSIQCGRHQGHCEPTTPSRFVYQNSHYISMKPDFIRHLCVLTVTNWCQHKGYVDVMSEIYATLFDQRLSSDWMLSWALVHVLYVCRYVCVCVYACMYICRCVYMCVCVCVHMYVCRCVCLNVSYTQWVITTLCWTDFVEWATYRLAHAYWPERRLFDVETL